MEYLAKNPKSLFIGQAVNVEGTAMSNTLTGVDKNKLIELPVAEEMQMGMTLGLALNGHIPVSIFPRWNFLLCGVNQLINHIDKIPLMSDFKTKIIIRTGIGAENPLHPQHQHVGDFTESFKLMSSNLDIIKLEEPEDIFPAYQKAIERNDNKTTILVEYGDYYNLK